ncbi:hypothetical protein BpHYR1_026508 [Brachionus plicatilis]|uniref:Uncharacterized protein n=1 Tax=Brachionus plicatilis TaxID=10195 RepID=A0A3M7PAW7_BRAPC|nr:hypothetical protein BpHYR1_026508 [Brachionus plicatilis]
MEAILRFKFKNAFVSLNCALNYLKHSKNSYDSYHFFLLISIRNKDSVKIFSQIVYSINNCGKY